MFNNQAPPPKRYKLEIGALWIKQGQYGEQTEGSLNLEKLMYAIGQNPDPMLKIKLMPNTRKTKANQPDFRIVCQNIQEPEKLANSQDDVIPF